MARHATNADLNADAHATRIRSDTAMTKILQEHQQEEKRKRGRPTQEGLDPALLLDMDLSHEVGALTPPVRIYRVDPITGALILKEQVAATTFRRRALESTAGKNFQKRLDDLQQKRQRAGSRSKARARLARSRYANADIKPRYSDEDERTEG